MLILLAAALLPFTAACGADSNDFQLDEAEPSQVQQLEFIPEHTVEVQGACLYGDKGICYLYDYYEETVPDERIMTIRQCPSGPRPLSLGEMAACDVVEVSIDAEDFNMLGVRDVVTVDDNGDVTRIPQKSELW
jgi:hypothetical protein